jgi:hypothetical protein
MHSPIIKKTCIYIVGRLDVYTFHVVLEKSRRLVLSRTSCSKFGVLSFFLGGGKMCLALSSFPLPPIYRRCVAAIQTNTRVLVCCVLHTGSCIETWPTRLSPFTSLQPAPALAQYWFRKHFTASVACRSVSVPVWHESWNLTECNASCSHSDWLWRLLWFSVRRHVV